MATQRVIFHVDMDAFFASVEQLDNPELRGRPVLVGHDGSRGVVAAASYEARVFGCRSALPMVVAKRKCPHAIVVPVRGGRYREVSAQVFDIFERYSPLIEPLSIDEAFLDMTGTERLLGSPGDVAQKLKDKVRELTGLAASVGVAPNKFLAKVASDLDKPDGLTIIPHDGVDRALAPLPVSRLWGIGPVACAKLADMGIRTIGDLKHANVKLLASRFGDHAHHMMRLARGEDERPVVSDHEAKSIGQEQTFGQDVAEPDAVRAVLLEQVEQVARRLRKHQVFARCVTLKIRFGDFETITRSETRTFATQSTDELWVSASAIFDKWRSSAFRPVRLIGMTVSQLSGDEGQLDLYDNPDREKRKKIDEVSDKIVQRFGKASLHRGATGHESKTDKLRSSLRADENEAFE